MCHRFGKKVPEVLKHIVESCWEADYQKRPEFGQLSKQMDEIWYTLPREQNSVCSAESGPGKDSKGCCCIA